jgi:hypothetical protein
MSGCGSLMISKGVMWVPQNDREFVEQAARPISDVLGLEKAHLCPHAEWLEKDHRGISDMCQKALKPEHIKKTNQDYFYSILPRAAIGAGVGLALGFLKSGTSELAKTILIGAVLGLIVGWSRIYSAKEVDIKETEVSLKARTEKNWLRSKQPQIDQKLKEAEDQVQKFKLDDFESDVNIDVIKQRDQLLLLKSYVESAVGSRNRAGD